MLVNITSLQFPENQAENTLTREKRKHTGRSTGNAEGNGGQ